MRLTFADATYPPPVRPYSVFSGSAGYALRGGPRNAISPASSSSVLPPEEAGATECRGGRQQPQSTHRRSLGDTQGRAPAAAWKGCRGKRAASGVWQVREGTTSGSASDAPVSGVDDAVASGAGGTMQTSEPLGYCAGVAYHGQNWNSRRAEVSQSGEHWGQGSPPTERRLKLLKGACACVCECVMCV